MPMMAAVSHAFVFPAMQSMIAAKARVMNISERRESALTIDGAVALQLTLLLGCRLKTSPPLPGDTPLA